MKEFKYTINGNVYSVAVGDMNGNLVEVTVNGESYSVELEQKKVKKERVVVSAPKPAAKPAATAPAADGKAAAQGDALKSPLPGVIKEVCVAVGDKVEEGQTVIVLEAMKMANNLEAEHAGTVTAVLVQQGESVMENSPLVVIG
ncbi:MAG: acetyl-CoA carboxylase biotin carboxyl carrier protein subunit [Bacteroidales bacterium]|nr:acetyl-CoA carboxylase biotin carboxyl carrier protein subunit [Bacteroidales bacterium]MDD6494863.1 acetyl-CoA carboxylase biotin carboxyl carrier protein subunit [Bacteroidales bacterium]